MVFNNYPLENSPSEYPNVHLLQFQRMGYEVRATVVHLKNIAAHKKVPFSFPEVVITNSFPE